MSPLYTGDCPNVPTTAGFARADTIVISYALYFASCALTSGSTGVPSALTASSAAGSSPNTFTIVGATCLVAVTADTVWAVKAGFATSRMTLVSSCANPP